ncbi:hypothetical protein [Janthinobacterium fluminis]|uniref:Uncharacterized protein n=1 Tax=Janthinobacterium fluminis TaxID=2987524 RepID=A0ABT5JZT2_9BURK|nr:hypothetical protein [Janthinobacterium fluminis]MDC8758243.1 hypothetical protein [Janthinobacterium fluminis]
MQRSKAALCKEYTCATRLFLYAKAQKTVRAPNRGNWRSWRERAFNDAAASFFRQGIF